MLIHLKGCYTILGKIASNSKEPRLRFSVPLEEKPPVIVDIIPNENSVESFREFEVSEEMWGILHACMTVFWNDFETFREWEERSIEKLKSFV